MTASGLVRRAGFALGVRLTRLALRTIGFSRTVRLVGSLPTPFTDRTATIAAVQRWADDIELVGGRPYGASCLDRSVFLWFVMHQRNLDAYIRIGVTFDHGRLDGHAWVELDGTVVNDDPDVADRFAVFEGDPIGIVFS
ncbi:MAG: lasso peptide biosynthesis B2 protein [Actinomycetia bacterium]|nr:lasso peptide biosynthesis B2 protein [Actinomycetes bacterium]